MGGSEMATAALSVRRAGPGDRDRLVEWNAAMALETEQRALSEQTLRAGVEAVLTDADKGFYLIAERDDEPLGGLLITFEWSDWRNAPMWWFQSVYVEPAARGQGVFHALYEAVHKQAKSAGAAALRLYVERDNQIAQKVYEARGMRPSEYLMYESVLP